MFINSLCALALGFALDMAVGDINKEFYPPNLLRKMIVSLEKSLKKAYADSEPAQNMAGIMLIIITLVIVLGISLALFILFYSLSTAAGIIFEALLCWMSFSIKRYRAGSRGVFLGAKYSNISSARESLKEISPFDTEQMDMDQAVRAAVDSVSQNTANYGISPIFWGALLGGIGSILCTSINIINQTVNLPGSENENKDFGKYIHKSAYAVNFIPNCIACALMKLNIRFFKFDITMANECCKKSTRQLKMQNICAGALGIETGGEFICEGKTAAVPFCGKFTRPAQAYDIYWCGHFLNGTCAYAVIFTFIIKIALYIIACLLF